MVGLLTRKSSGAISFTYDQAWLSWEHALPVSLSLPLREDAHIGLPVTAVFENLLPDNHAIRQRVAQRVSAEGIDIGTTDAIQTLPMTKHETRNGRW